MDRPCRDGRRSAVEGDDDGAVSLYELGDLPARPQPGLGCQRALYPDDGTSTQASIRLDGASLEIGSLRRVHDFVPVRRR